MVLQLYNDANQFMCQLDEIHRKLGFYSPEDGYGIHVRHHSFHPTHCAFRKDGAWCDQGLCLSCRRFWIWTLIRSLPAGGSRMSLWSRSMKFRRMPTTSERVSSADPLGIDTAQPTLSPWSPARVCATPRRENVGVFSIFVSLIALSLQTRLVTGWRKRRPRTRPGRFRRR